MRIDNISFKNRHIRISTHILFWIAVVIFYTFFFGHLEGYLKHTFLVMVLFTLVTAATTYTFNYYLIPRYLFKRAYLLFGLLSFYTILLSFYFVSFIIFGMLFVALEQDALLDRTVFDLYFLIVAQFVIIFFGVMVKFYKHWHEKQTINLELLKEKTEAELQMLKSQINPHFLFNTLNSIYSLSLKKSDYAPEVVLRGLIDIEFRQQAPQNPTGNHPRNKKKCQQDKNKHPDRGHGDRRLVQFENLELRDLFDISQYFRHGSILLY